MSSECCWYWNFGFNPNCNWWRNRHGWRNRSCYRKSWCSWWKVQDQVTEPSKIGEGSRSRVKVYLLNDYPTEVINSTKLPLGRQVVLNFFFNLLEDSDQTKHSNPHSFELLSLFRKHMWYLTAAKQFTFILFMNNCCFIWMTTKIKGLFWYLFMYFAQNWFLFDLLHQNKNMFKAELDTQNYYYTLTHFYNDKCNN